LAEESGLVVALGRWVLDEAGSQMQRWQRDLPEAEGLRVSVNLSVRQIESPTIVEDIGRIVAENGVDPRRLTLEITESLVMDDVPEIRERLESLRASGITLAVDDFGTGFSSLGYIQRFPVDVIKIDRGFVDRLDAPGGTSGVVRTIVELSRDLGTLTVAEGIETAEQLAQLVALSCQYGQGFYFSRPLPAAEFAALVTNPDRLSVEMDTGAVIRLR
jgi:Amt family ammonium transporter